jgi:hypothetical protein
MARKRWWRDNINFCMTKHLLWLFAVWLALPYNVSAQDSTRHFFIAPGARLSFYDSDPPGLYSKKDIAGMEIGAGCMYLYKRLAIEAGARYKLISYTTTLTNYTQGGIGQSGVPYSSKVTVRVDLLDLPIKINYILGKRRLFFLSAEGDIALFPVIYFRNPPTSETMNRHVRKGTGKGFNFGGGMIINAGNGMLKPEIGIGYFHLDNRIMNTSTHPSQGIQLSRYYINGGFTLYLGKKKRQTG